MAQYITFENNQYKEFFDPDTGLKKRVGQRDHLAVYDKELVPGGFVLNVEDTSWENIGGFGDEVTGSKCRMGVRDGNWQIDIELTPLGFAGAEDTDWENVGSIDIV